MTLRCGVIASILVLAVMVGILQGTTDVHQTYRLLALTAWDEQEVFWILEDTSGEGEGSRLLQVVLGKGHQPVLMQTWFKHFGTWQWLVDGIGTFETQEYVPLMEGRGVFADWKGKLFVREPRPDTLALRKFHNHIYASGSGGTLPSWNAEQGLAGISAPTIDAFESEVVYCYPEGLYIDYDFSQVFHFPRQQYVLVFTHQDRLGPGLDTMHGFIILRIGKSGG